MPDLGFLSASQCFPLKLYQPIRADKEDNNKQKTKSNKSLALPQDQNDNLITAPSGTQYRVTDGISDKGLKHFSGFYQKSITKEELFYYLYGLLHSPDYRQRFANNLSKELPHIPRVKAFADFQAFAQAGRTLADLHLNYEDKEPYAVDYEEGKAVGMLKDEEFRVEKMRFKNKSDKSTIVYNSQITLSNVPLEAYDYVVNGKSAIEWVMERQRISTHKDSGITNDPNDWAKETMNNPRYPLDLLLKVITISLDTLKTLKTLPKLEF